VWREGGHPGRVVMRPGCPEHGEHVATLASDARFYWQSFGQREGGCCGGKCGSADGSGEGTLGRNAEGHEGSPFETLSTCFALIEIVRSCNLSCPTCYADSPLGAGAKVDAVPLAEIKQRIEGVVARKGGIEILQLSGGEPTLHPQLFELLDWVQSHPKIDYALINTNGVRIAHDAAFAEQLAVAAPRLKLQLYLQFDGVQEAGQYGLRGADLRATREAAIARCAEMDLPVTLAMTVTPENLPHVWEAIAFGLSHPNVHGITFQPMFTSGRVRGAGLPSPNKHSPTLVSGVPLTRPSATLSPSDRETAGVRGFSDDDRNKADGSLSLGLERNSQRPVEGQSGTVTDAALVSSEYMGCAATQPYRTSERSSLTGNDPGGSGSTQSKGTAGKPFLRWRRWLSWIVRGTGVLVGSLISACAVFFQGPYVPTEPLPQAKLIDLHCHTAGIGAGGSGCFVSKAMRDSYKFEIYLKAFGVTRAEVEAKGDALILQRISEQISRSTKVGAAVILSMDGVVDDHGQLDTNRTEVYVPIEFVARETARYPNLLWGAGINPLRSDALERLDWAATNGAVLVKWIPSIMLIDPSDERIIPFYQRMKALGLPLLCHAGRERSFTFARDELCDPERLKLPLELGVTVIVAHIASTGANGGEPDMERLARMMATYPNLYSEISSLTQVNKPGYLEAALTRPEFKGRLLYGTDFPLINTALVSPWYFPLRIRPNEARRIAKIENAWDRDVALKQALGVPQEIFERTGQILRTHKGQTTDGHR
jgi:predicted TIM-barrel fold metal-dependent hydrolase/organic radical activating enzyme